MIKKEQNNRNQSNFWLGFILLVISTSTLALLIQHFSNKLIHPGFWIIQGFFWMISILSHLISQIGIKNSGEFHVFYLGSMAVRFILSLFFILLSLVYLSENKIIYAVNFFILYITYASFEIYHLLRNLRADSQRNDT